MTLFQFQATTQSATARFFPNSNNTATYCFVFLVLGVWIGSSWNGTSTTTTTISNNDSSFLDTKIIPFYTLLVVLYLLECLWDKKLLGVQRQQQQQQLKQQPQHQPPPPIKSPITKEAAATKIITTTTAAKERKLLNDKEEQPCQLQPQTTIVQQQTKEQQQSLLLSQPPPPPKQLKNITNLTGAFQLVDTDKNYDKFLAVQGVPWTYRRMALSAKPVHRITHDQNDTQLDKLTIKIEASLYESETSYVINGPPVQSNVRGRIFSDTITYLPAGDGVQNYKRAIGDEGGEDDNKENNNKKAATKNNFDTYNVIIHRQLLKDGETMKMTCRVIFPNDKKKKPIEATQLFKRIKQ